MNRSYIKDFETWASDFNYAAHLTVRFSDLDAYGIVNNAVIVSYLEYARIEFIKDRKLVGNWLSESYPTALVLANLQCDYTKPIQFDEKLKIYVKVAKFGSSSVEIHYLGKDSKDHVVFTASTTLVQIDKQTGKGFPWTEEEKEKFLQ